MSSSATLGLNALRQALIQHDLRADPWPDFLMSATMCRRADVCFTDLETAIPGPLEASPTRDKVFRRAVKARTRATARSPAAWVPAFAGMTRWIVTDEL
jgi:hypothetical protein